jgi:hypothetical protein
MNRNPIFVLFILLTVLLAACNLPGSAETTSPAGSDTEVTPGPIPAAQENTPVPDAQNTPESQPELSQSACDHPYFPMRTGSTWTFEDRANQTTITWTVTEVTGDRQTAEAKMNVSVIVPGQAEAIALNYAWQCNASEGLVSFDYVTLSNVDTGQGELTLQMKQVEGSGILIPPAEQLTPGTSWTLSISGEFTMEMGAGLSADGVLNIAETDQVLNVDAISYQGQSYEGVLIERDILTQIQVNVGGMNTDTDTTMRMLMSLARGIGPVLQQSETEFGATELELISYSIP